MDDVDVEDGAAAAADLREGLLATAGAEGTRESVDAEAGGLSTGSMHRNSMHECT